MSGDVVRTYDYDAFGVERSPQEGDSNPFRYCGEHFDRETGTVYLRARYYDPVIGRFLSEDPAGDGLNWYTYCGNNPVVFVDFTGLAPTVMEAALMAQHVYAPYDGVAYELSGGWAQIDTLTGGDGMVMGVYSRTQSNGAVEYALVSKGSLVDFMGEHSAQTWSDWGNNVQGPLGFSDDIKAGIKASIAFDEAHKNDEITFIGHSKGGAEATANAVATNRNAILFNPMSVNLGAYEGTKGKTYTAGMTAYIVGGDILNNIFGKVSNPIGKAVYLPNQNVSQWWQAWNHLGNSIKNHSMESVIAALRAEGY